jgi:hypothetical protein
MVCFSGEQDFSKQEAMCVLIFDYQLLRWGWGMPSAGLPNAACGDGNPRVRRWQSPAAALGIAAAGVWKGPMGAFPTSASEGFNLG